jgi:hypothetical protein
MAQSERRGANFLSGTRCFANGQGDDAIRLAFSFQPAEQIEEGIARIGAAMRASECSHPGTCNQRGGSGTLPVSPFSMSARLLTHTTSQRQDSAQTITFRFVMQKTPQNRRLTDCPQ